MSELDLFIQENTGSEAEYQEVLHSINRYLHEEAQMSDKAYEIYQAFEYERINI